MDGLRRRWWLRSLIGLVPVVAGLLAAGPARAQSAAGAGATPGAEPVIGARALVGLWHAKRRFGPEVRGRLTIEIEGESGTAAIAGRTAPLEIDGDRVVFALPGGEGAFRGRLESDRIVGHWTQPGSPTSGYSFSSPVVLERNAGGPWQGEVVPLDDEFTLFLSVREEDDTVSGFLRNPERNLGVFLDVDRITRDRDSVRLIGRFLGRGDERVLAEGVVRDDDRLSIYIPNRGGTYDFTRLDGAPGDFAPRGGSVRYAYAKPPDEGDGWETATLEEVGISRERIEAFVQMLIDAPTESVHSPYVHGVLIARRGKLVLEEYFHGFHRLEPHDTRSASKSLTSTLVGAAIQARARLDPSEPVYAIMYDGAPPADLDPRKGRMTVEDLLTMSSGFHCDDRDPTAPGNEDVMQEQTGEPDWWRYTLALPMADAPGAEAVYCSANAHLLGGVLARVTGRSLPELFHELIAEPLQVDRYHLNLTPTGDAYMGGGIYWLPRDFMKLGQLMLDDGVWNGRRIVSEAWARRATAPLRELRELGYGYLWWVADYPYRERTVRAFFAAGNGGQIVMGIPELELVIVFYGGNYSDPVLYVPQRVYVPEWILPAVD